MNGLPELPEGYFFRVRPWTFGGGMGKYTLMVKLRRKTWWGSHPVGSSISEHTPEAIREAAHSALREWLQSLERKRTIHLRRQFVGDYPPKTLEQDFSG